MHAPLLASSGHQHDRHIAMTAKAVAPSHTPTQAAVRHWGTAERQRAQTGKQDTYLEEGRINPFLSTTARNCSELS